MDDQVALNDARENMYVSPAIETACAVYDALFDALKFLIRGKSTVIKKLDKTVESLEKRCDSLVEKYEELLSKLNELGGKFSAEFSLDFAREALDLLNEYPQLRRYLGEANYWLLWDTVATLANQGAALSADIISNIKEAAKAAIIAAISMTDGLLHFESYLTQITQFWGWLYAKEIPLRLTENICPQVTCRYYYKPVAPGNPVPGAADFMPMPIPVFDYSKYSIPEISENFAYDNPEKWEYLTPASRSAMERARRYWTSSYTNAQSVNSIATSISSAMTGGDVVVGFGAREKYVRPGSNTEENHPLRVGTTFTQLDTQKDKQFPFVFSENPLFDKLEKVDSAFQALVAVMVDGRLENARAEIEKKYADLPDSLKGSWGESIAYMEGSVAAYYEECVAVVKDSSEYNDWATARKDVIEAYAAYRAELVAMQNVFKNTGMDAPSIYVPGESADGYNIVELLLHQAMDLAEIMGPTSTVLDLVKAHPISGYSIYTGGDGAFFAYYGANYNYASEYELYDIPAHYVNQDKNDTPFYTKLSEASGADMDIAGEVGQPIDSGREPIFPAIGVYGNVIGMRSWNYRIVPITHLMDYARIKDSYHIYYKKSDPTKLIFADHRFGAGMFQYIAVHDYVAQDTITHGNESYDVYIFPGETCTVSYVEFGQAFGTQFPNFASLQTIDVENEDGTGGYIFDLATNAIPKFPKYVDAKKWSAMDIIHELWLLADFLAPICGDGGRRKTELADVLSALG
ncbi:MAG: hypothetical protein Q4Q25_00830 [Methanocorpusculum sp.]|nr:hypothetical protein [Methanocorpusculum sp.]